MRGCCWTAKAFAAAWQNLAAAASEIANRECRRCLTKECCCRTGVFVLSDARESHLHGAVGGEGFRPLGLARKVVQERREYRHDSGCKGADWRRPRPRQDLNTAVCGASLSLQCGAEGGLCDGVDGVRGACWESTGCGSEAASRAMAGPAWCTRLSWSFRAGKCALLVRQRSNAWQLPACVIRPERTGCLCGHVFGLFGCYLILCSVAGRSSIGLASCLFHVHVL